MLLKVITVKNVLFATLSFLTIRLSIKILLVRIVMQYVSINDIAIVTIKSADYVVLLMTLANLMQLVY